MTHTHVSPSPPFHSGEHSSTISSEIRTCIRKTRDKISLLKHAAFTLFARENLAKQGALQGPRGSSTKQRRHILSLGQIKWGATLVGLLVYALKTKLMLYVQMVNYQFTYKKYRHPRAQHPDLIHENINILLHLLQNFFFKELKQYSGHSNIPSPIPFTSLSKEAATLLCILSTEILSCLNTEFLCPCWMHNP